MRVEGVCEQGAENNTLTSTLDMEKSLIDGGDDRVRGLPLCIVLHSFPAPSALRQQPKALVAGDGNHVVITANILENRTAGQVEGNMETYAENGSVQL
jgi:hypothetical protein